MKVKTLTVGMVGAGGDGVVASGAVAQEGLYALSTKSFGPQIRGGECSMRVRIATEPVEHTGSGLDYLIVLNWRDYHRFAGELNMKPTGVIICEKDPKVAVEGVPDGLGLKRHEAQASIGLRLSCPTGPGLEVPGRGMAARLPTRLRRRRPLVKNEEASACDVFSSRQF